MWRDFSFEYPEAAYLLLFGLLIAYFRWNLYLARQSVEAQYTSPRLVSQLIRERSFNLTLVKESLLVVTWIFICFALMGPKGNVHFTTLASNNIIAKVDRQLSENINFLVDVSRSMETEDEPHGKTRLEKAKEMAEEIVLQLKGENISLYAFTSVLTPEVPLTQDYLFFRMILSGLQINVGGVGGTEFYPVLDNMKNIIQEYPSESNTLIIISDGGDKTIEAATDLEARNSAIHKITDIFSNPQAMHLHIYAIGVGSLTGATVPGVSKDGKSVNSKLEEDLLKNLAEKGRGVYYSLNEQPQWNIANDLVKRIQDHAFSYKKSGELTMNPVVEEDILYDHYFYVPMLLGIISLLGWFILPDVKKT